MASEKWLVRPSNPGAGVEAGLPQELFGRLSLTLMSENIPKPSFARSTGSEVVMAESLCACLC